MEGSTTDIRTQLFAEITLFKVFARVKCILQHYSEFPPKQLIILFFLEGDFPKNNQRWSTGWQNVGTKKQPEIWNMFVPSNPKTSPFDCCHQIQLRLEWYDFFDQPTNFYSQLLSSGPWEKLNHFKRFNYVDSDNTLHNTKITTLNAALPDCQKILPCGLQGEVPTFVWRGNSFEKILFFHLLWSQQGLEFWGSQDHPIFYQFIWKTDSNLAIFSTFCKVFTI